MERTETAGRSVSDPIPKLRLGRWFPAAHIPFSIEEDADDRENAPVALGVFCGEPPPSEIGRSPADMRGARRFERRVWGRVRAIKLARRPRYGATPRRWMPRGLADVGAANGANPVPS